MTLAGTKTDGLRCVAFDPDSRWLVAGGGANLREPRRSVTVRELIAWNLPGGEIHWQVVENSDEPISDLALRPGGAELATKCTGDITIWSASGQVLRTFKNDFLAGSIVYSPDGKKFVSPAGNSIKVRQSDTGGIVTQIPISKKDDTSAKAAAFLSDGSRILIAARVIDSKGHISGRLLLGDLEREKIIQSTVIDFDPNRAAVDPEGRWACITGERRNRGWVLFWDLAKWQQVTDQGAHGRGIDGLAFSPDGGQIATTGTDNLVRIWDIASGKTVARLDQHRAERKAAGGVAWSPDGRYIVLACMGAPPAGGVFLYERLGDEWNLAGGSPSDVVSAAQPAVRPPQEKQPAQLPAAAMASGAAAWFKLFLQKLGGKKSLATKEAVADWEKKHTITLPRAYADFVTTIGRHSFADVFGWEGYAVRIVGPSGLDATEYRRDEPQDPADESEPDGLMFAVAVNGDCLCFDLRDRKKDYAVYRFDHETESFELFAENFAAAVRRMVKKE